MAIEEPKLSLGALFARFSTQVSDLFRAEVALMKAQAKAAGSRFGLAAGLLAGAGVFALFMLGYLIKAMFYGFTALTGLAAWGALLTAAVLLVLTAILALIGLSAAKRAKDNIPEPQKHVKKDVETLKAAIKRPDLGAEK
ncbi:phage holin family protein [uncultured Mobiluncus sp.]|uniref:phage holin family protein n=1 Tax=uncultured Mobiluncus sp. TaxID=293425 RepID=UPI0027D9B09E|nr:phage holin family protein [uncultured Mobiluncus sp.]